MWDNRRGQPNRQRWKKPVYRRKTPGGELAKVGEEVMQGRVVQGRTWCRGSGEHHRRQRARQVQGQRGAEMASMSGAPHGALQRGI